MNPSMASLDGQREAQTVTAPKVRCHRGKGESGSKQSDSGRPGPSFSIYVWILAAQALYSGIYIFHSVEIAK